MAGGQATSQTASGSPRRWKEADELLGLPSCGTSAQELCSKHSLSLLLLSVVLEKGPVTTSVSGREAHRQGAGCGGGWAKVKGGLKVGAHSLIILWSQCHCLPVKTPPVAMLHTRNYSQLARSYDIIKPFNPTRT